MSSLKETYNELDRLEKKVLDSAQAYKKLIDITEGTVIGNQVYGMFGNAIQGCNEIINKITELKNVSKSTGDVDLGNFKSDIKGLNADISALAGNLRDSKNYVLRMSETNPKKLASAMNIKVPDIGSGIDADKIQDDVDGVANKVEEASDREVKANNKAKESYKSKAETVLNVMQKVASVINSAVNKIVGIIRSGIKLVSKSFSIIGSIISGVVSGVKKIITLFGSLSNRVRSLFGGADKSGQGLNGTFNILKGSATELRSKIMLLKGAFDAIFNNQFINKGKNLLTSIATMNVVIGKELTNNTIEWAKSLEGAMGISATDLLSDIKEISAVLYGLGMNSEDTALGAQNLGMMSRYLGMMGLAGGDVNQVMNKLASGMKGMTQAIDDLGLSVRDSQMNSFLKDLKNGTNELSQSLKAQGVDLSKISTDFSSLNEEARVYIRYASLIEQFKSNYDMTDFAKQLNTVTGRLSILSQTWSSFATVIGVALSKVGALLATYLIPLIKRMQTLVENILVSIQKSLNRLGNFFGIDLDMNIGDELSADSNSIDTSGLDDVNNKLDDTSDKLKDVSKEAKKANGNLQSFDRVNNVTSSSSSSSSSSSDNFYYSQLMNSALDGLNEYTKATDNYFKKLDKNIDKTVNKIKKKMKKVMDDITNRKLDFGFNWDKIKSNLRKGMNGVWQFLKKWAVFTIKIALKMADDVKIGKIITKLSELWAKLWEVANIITDVLQPALDTFYEIGIKPIMQYLGVKAVSLIDLMINKLDDLGNWFKDNEQLINEWFKNLGEKVAQAFRVITNQETLDDLLVMKENGSWSKFLRVLDDIPNKVNRAKDAVSELVSVIKGTPSLSAEMDIASGTVWGNVLSIINSLRDILGQLIKDLGSFVKSDILPWLQEKLKQIADWLAENKDKLVDLLEKLASIAWDSFKVFVDLVGKLIDYVVNNPDSVQTFLKTLITLKVASWVGGVAASLGKLVFWSKQLNVMGGLSGILGGVKGAASAVGGALSAVAPAAAGLGGITGIIGLGSGIKDIVTAGKEDTEEAKRQKQNTGIAKVMSVGSGAAIGAGIGSFIPGIGTAIGAGIGAGIGGIVGIAQGENIGKNIVEGIRKGISSAWSGLKDFFSIFSGLIDFVKSIFGIHSPSKVFAEIGVYLVAGLLNGIQSAWEGLTSTITGLCEGLLNGITGIFSGIGDWFYNVFTGAKDKVSEAWSDVKERWADIKNGITDVFNDIGSWFSDKFIDARNKVTGAFDNIGDWFSNTFSNAREKASSAFDGIKDKISNTCEHAKSNIINKFNDIGSIFGGFADKAISGFSKIVDGVSSFAGKARDAVSNALNSAKSFVSNTWGNVKDFGSGVVQVFTGRTSARSASTITTHAVGGSINGGQLFIANENGGAELVGNITGASGAQVANNGMILDAMRTGVFEAVYNAMAEVQSQRGTSNGSGDTKIEINGFGLIDNTTLRKLGRMLETVKSSNSNNITNTNFSI